MNTVSEIYFSFRAAYPTVGWITPMSSKQPITGGTHTEAEQFLTRL